MRYKIRRKGELKKRIVFDTYEPSRRIGLSEGEAWPLFVRLGHEFICLGGFFEFWASSILVGLKNLFGFKKKIENFSFNNKVVEIRVKKD